MTCCFKGDLDVEEVVISLMFNYMDSHAENIDRAQRELGICQACAIRVLGHALARAFTTIFSADFGATNEAKDRFADSIVDAMNVLLNVPASDADVSEEVRSLRRQMALRRLIDHEGECQS